jgi:hypothetical protein
VETVLVMLTAVYHFKKVIHRVWTYFHARLAFTMAAFSVLVPWYGVWPKTYRPWVPWRFHKTISPTASGKEVNVSWGP